MLLRVVGWMFSVGAMVFCAGVVSSQNYPNKPIRIVTAGSGSPHEFLSRVIAPALTRSLGQQVIVDNRGIIAMEIVAKAPPDGYTLLVYGSPLWLSSALRDNVQWDPVKDFAPITLALSSPSILAINPSLPVKSVKELIALAIARPGELNFGAVSIGSVTQLAGELFKSMAGINITDIFYRSTGAALSGLLSGQIHLIFSTGAVVMPHVKTGKLRALAVTGAKPSALYPELPTIAAEGLPGYETTSLTAICAPARTPAAVIRRLNQEIVQALNRPDVKEKLLNTGAETVGSSPEQLAATIKTDMARWGKVIKDAGIRMQ